MSVLIKGMSKPRDCMFCFSYRNGYCGLKGERCISSKGVDADCPITEVADRKTEPIIYGNEHNCIMTMFGECSYNETGCGSCAVVEKVRNALDKYEPKDEPQTDCPWR